RQFDVYPRPFEPVLDYAQRGDGAVPRGVGGLHCWRQLAHVPVWLCHYFCGHANVWLGLEPMGTLGVFTALRGGTHGRVRQLGLGSSLRGHLDPCYRICADLCFGPACLVGDSPVSGWGLAVAQTGSRQTPFSQFLRQTAVVAGPRPFIPIT